MPETCYKKDFFLLYIFFFIFLRNFFNFLHLLKNDSTVVLFSFIQIIVPKRVNRNFLFIEKYKVDINGRNGHSCR